MPLFDLLPKNYDPISNGEATESPTTFTNVVTAGFANTRDALTGSSSARLISQIQEERATAYQNLEGTTLLARNYSQANPILSLASSQDQGGEFSPRFATGLDEFIRPDLWGFAQRLHKDDTYVNLHIKELKEKDPLKYEGLLTNDEIKQEAMRRSNVSLADYQNVSSRADEDTAFWGGIIGSIGGALTDPLNVITMPLGAGAAGGILRAVAIESGIQAGVEAVQQPAILKWQEELGRDYDLGDAATNVMGAAILGGTFTGIVRGARPTAQAVFAKMQSSTTLNSLQKQAAGYMSRVAHFREANPNPKVVSELHTDTVDAVNKVVRAGNEPSTASLPMTERDFLAIDTVNTRGLNTIQKQQISQVDEFVGSGNIRVNAYHGTNQEFDTFSIKELGTATNVDNAKRGFFFTSSKDEALAYGEYAAKTRVVNQDALETEIDRLLDEVDKLNSSGKFEEADLLSGKIEDMESTSLKTGLDPVVKDVSLNIDNPLRFDAKGLNMTTDKIDGLIDKALSNGNDGIIFKNIKDNPKGFGEPETTQYFVFDSNKISNGFVTDQDIPKEFRVGSDDVPSVIEPIPQPLTNAENAELLKRLDSIDAEKANAQNFKQLVDAQPNKAITLDDGTTVSLRTLQKQFDDEQAFLDEISTCAIG